MTSGTFPAPNGARADVLPQEEGKPSSNNGGSSFDSSRPELSGGHPGEEAGMGAEQTARSSGTTLAEMLDRGKTTLQTVRGNLRSLRLATPYLKPKSARELELVAHEEEVRLIQRIFLTGDKRAQVVVFCGIESGGGCSRICVESAVTLASQVPGTVCLVDANLRSPALHHIFGLKNGKGFAEAMLQFAPIREYGHQLSNLWVLTSGAPAPDPHTLLNSETFRLRMKELREDFEYVIIDAPPLNPFADATKLGAQADGIVLVVGANSTRREAAKKAKEELNSTDSKILAAVLNRRTFPIPEPIYKRL